MTSILSVFAQLSGLPWSRRFVPARLVYPIGVRVLYVDVKSTYLNPTQALVRQALARTTDVVEFGPGWVTSECLHRGLPAFMKQTGPYDVLVTESLFPTYATWADPRGPRATYREWRRGRHLHFSYEDSILVPKIAADLAQVQLPKVALLLGFDVYNYSIERVQALESGFQMLVGFPSNLVPPVGNAGDANEDVFHAQANNIYRDFADRNASLLLPFPLFVADDEFSSVPWEQRHWDFSIPGQPYANRQTFRAEVRARRASVAPNRAPWIAKAARLIGLSPYSNELFLGWYSSSFRSTLHQSRVSYTCGSSLGLPVRKFFEIPAAEALLAATPTDVTRALGFEDRVNFWGLSSPSDLEDLLVNLRESPASLAIIAKAGQALVRDHHSIGRRAADLHEALLRLLAGRWKGAVIEKGRVSIH